MIPMKIEIYTGIGFCVVALTLLNDCSSSSSEATEAELQAALPEKGIATGNYTFDVKATSINVTRSSNGEPLPVSVQNIDSGSVNLVIQ